MNARFYSLKTTIAAALICTLSLGATAHASSALDARAPLRATLMPKMIITANASDPAAAVQWSVAKSRPLRVTLMPTMTVRPDVASMAANASAGIEVLAALASPSSGVVPSLGAGSRYELAD